MIEDAKDRGRLLDSFLLLDFASLAVRSKKSGGASSDEGLEGIEP